MFILHWATSPTNTAGLARKSGHGHVLACSFPPKLLSSFFPTVASHLWAPKGHDPDGQCLFLSLSPDAKKGLEGDQTPSF